MKHFFLIILSLMVFSYANSKEKIYTGSTPAGKEVRSFLGIPISDSIDFIRWQLTVTDFKYSIKCNYGIGKPNTNQFMNGGKWIEFSGITKRERNNLTLHHEGKYLGLVEINDDLVHILDAKKNLMIGNGGWSYTLNVDKPSGSSKVYISSKQEQLKDSMVFQGRTPCLLFADVKKGTTCYKLKWLIVLYSDTKRNLPSTYFLNGTVVQHKGKKGTWSIVKENDGRVLYKLISENGEALYLLKLDESILLFTDKNGNPLVGDEDFSFTLNRK